MGGPRPNGAQQGVIPWRKCPTTLTLTRLAQQNEVEFMHLRGEGVEKCYPQQGGIPSLEWLLLASTERDRTHG